MKSRSKVDAITRPAQPNVDVFLLKQSSETPNGMRSIRILKLLDFIIAQRDLQ